jgi:hypothetical protein
MKTGDVEESSLISSIPKIFWKQTFQTYFDEVKILKGMMMRFNYIIIIIFLRKTLSRDTEEVSVHQFNEYTTT